MSSAGKFKLHVDRFYENKNTGPALEVVPRDDWHPFLTRVGLDRLTYFSGAVPGYKSFLAYSWKEICERNPLNALAWKSDGRGVETCQGEIEGGVTFGFIQEAIKTALVISTMGAPTDKLITTDEPSQSIAIQAQEWP